MRLLVVQIMAARGSTSNDRDRVRVQVRGAQTSHAQTSHAQTSHAQLHLCARAAQLFVCARCNPAPCCEKPLDSSRDVLCPPCLMACHKKLIFILGIECHGERT